MGINWWGTIMRTFLIHALVFLQPCETPSETDRHSEPGGRKTRKWVDVMGALVLIRKTDSTRVSSIQCIQIIIIIIMYNYYVLSVHYRARKRILIGKVGKLNSSQAKPVAANSTAEGQFLSLFPGRRSSYEPCTTKILNWPSKWNSFRFNAAQFAEKAATISSPFSTHLFPSLLELRLNERRRRLRAIQIESLEHTSATTYQKSMTTSWIFPDNYDLLANNCS